MEFPKFADWIDRRRINFDILLGKWASENSNIKGAINGQANGNN